MDAPYYEGTIVINPSEIVAARWDARLGGVSFVLKSGRVVRAVANEKARRCAASVGMLP